MLRTRRAYAGVVFAVGLLGVPSSPAEVTVRVDAPRCAPDGGSGTESDPYCRIQDAICAIKDTGGGTVLVHPGIYRESLRMFPRVSVVSTDGPAVTTIDASGIPCTTRFCLPSQVNAVCSTVVFGEGATPADRLDGFRITGGSGLYREFPASSPPDAVAGGGIFVFQGSPTISRNEIVDNVLAHGSTDEYWGAGIYVFGSVPAAPIRPTITDNLIAGNVASSPEGRPNSPTHSFGGGIYTSWYAAAR
ncbi:MAG TPA: hypothetical protein VD788_14770, partial [Candidatus Polarisedimenticolaceae bacterium]|nr:hypothetical protein [Candidatus Polarisedimenticolaceae bacterium]